MPVGLWFSGEVLPDVCRVKIETETTNKDKVVANYDSAGVLYDSGILYDATPLPQPPKRMPKAKVKLNLSGKSDANLSAFAQAHITAMTSNANFTTPLPSAANVTAALTPFQTALANFNTTQAAAKLATTTKDTARLALENVLTQRGNYVELIAAAAADPVAVIESAAFSTRSAGSATTVPDPVANLTITAGDNSGELDLQWDPTSGAKTYEVQLSPDPVTLTSWIAQPSVSKSKAVIFGLTSGAKMWARVRAVGAGGIGAWSDVATKIVP